MLKKEASKLEMSRANQAMLAAKAKQRELDASEEEKLVKLMMGKFAQDEANEQAAEAARVARREQYVEHTNPTNQTNKHTISNHYHLKLKL